MLQVWGSILLRTVKSDTVTSTVRHRCDVFLSRGDGPRNSLYASTEYREYNKDLIFFIWLLQDELLQTRSAYERRTQHDAAMIMHMQNTLSETQRGNTAAAGVSRMRGRTKCKTNFEVKIQLLPDKSKKTYYFFALFTEKLYFTDHKGAP